MSTAIKRQVVAYVGLLVLTLLLLAFSNSAPLVELRRGLGFALTPIQDTLRQGTRTVTSIFGTISEIDALRQQNEDLVRRVQEAEARVQQLESVAIENQQLAALLGVRSTISYATTAAEVITRRSTDQERVISLDSGTEAGIELDDPVIGEGGALVGRVIEVGQNFSRVLLVSDLRTNVAGLIEASRAIGDIHGQGDLLQMTNIPATDVVNVGETVVTAGIELETGVRSTYPKGLVIGTVVDVDRQPNQLFQTALVAPFARLDRLEYVLVVVGYEGGPTGASLAPSGSTGGSPGAETAAPSVSSLPTLPPTP
jgi:rod shape-determining protein MreC